MNDPVHVPIFCIGVKEFPSHACIQIPCVPWYGGKNEMARVITRFVPETTLEAMLVTLIENSRQAGATSLILSSATHEDAVMLRISDDGPGIASGDRDRIFEPFFTTRRATGGTGLGLAIARSLLGTAGGTIEIVDGPGATFAVSLPIAR